MSAPLASDIASRTGVVQQNIGPNVNKNSKIGKEGDAGRQVVFGREEEEENRGRFGAGGGPGAAGGTGQAQFGQDEKQKVKRKRVKLKDVANQQTQRSNQSGNTTETQRTREQAAARKAARQEAPTNARELGIKRATSLLNQQSRLTEASVKYEQARQAQDNTGTNPLSPKGQQRWMLNNLIKMSELNYHQHTGGSAGELLNRRSSREVFMALRGLRDGAPKTDTRNDTSNSRGMSSGEYKLKQAQAMTIIHQVLEPPVRPDSHEPLELVA